MLPRRPDRAGRLSIPVKGAIVRRERASRRARSARACVAVYTRSAPGLNKSTGLSPSTCPSQGAIAAAGGNAAIRSSRPESSSASSPNAADGIIGRDALKQAQDANQLLASAFKGSQVGLLT